MENSLTRLMHRFVLSSASWMLLCCFLCCSLLPRPSFAEEPGKIQYISRQDNRLSGQLVPDPSPGTVPATGNPLISFQIDGQPRQFTLSPAAGGRAAFSATLSGIAEGRHSALLKSDNLDGGVKDSRQLLFIYDTIPPNLECVFPAAPEIARNNLSFIVEFSDEGSGIPSQLEDIEVTATINGAAAAIETLEHGNRRSFLIDHVGRTGVEGGLEYQLFISLKDRAGNEATLEQSFRTADVPEEKTTEQKRCTTPGNMTFSFAATTRQEFGFPLTNRLSPVLFSREKMTDTVEIRVKTDEDLDPGILELITVTADHPQLELRRLPVAENDLVRYEVRQKSVVSSLDALASLRVAYPRTLAVDYEWQCSADGRRMEVSETNISTSADLVSFEVPVALYWRNSRSFETRSARDPDGAFFIEYHTWTEPSSQLLDTAASYLLLENSAYFFEQQSGTFISRAPVEKEGFYGFQVTLASAGGTWVHTGRPVGQEDHEMLFDLGGPVIDSFAYNREDGRLEALFSDLGTPAEDLQITLGIDGFGSRDFDIKALEDGKISLTSPFPLPPSLTSAHLSITDLARNRAQRSCRIFGIPPEQPADGTFSVSDYSLKEKAADSGNNYTVLSSLSGGLSVIRSCPVEQILAVSDYYITNREDLTSRRTTRYYPYRSYRAGGGSSDNLLHATSTELQPPLIEIIDPATGEPVMVAASSRSRDHTTYELFSFELCRNLIQDVLAPEIRSISFNPADNSLSATISDHGRPASQVKTGVSVSVGLPPGYGTPVAVDHQYTAEREPVISVAPSLSAPGMPTYSIKQKIINSLEVQRLNQGLAKIPGGGSKSSRSLSSADLADLLQAVDARIASLEKQQRADPAPFADGHGKTGTLAATVPMPPLVIGETYELTISARDGAGNVSYETLRLTVPRSPPVVTLEQINTDSVSFFAAGSGGQSSSHLRAAAVDESGLDLQRTYLDLDSVRLSPLSSFGSGGLGNPSRNPNARSFDDIVNDRYGTSLIDEYVAHYSALLGEGGHRARFTATDTLGISAEKSLDFTIEYLPKITNFVARPEAVQDIGGPAFTAMITDLGGDLEPGGITFFIDGREVERSRLYYDPPSGYFSVSGPFSHADGRHSAQIAAADNSGHRATETIFFAAGHEISGLDGPGDLRLETITIWELEQANNDGQANPGELIRIFPTVFNSGPAPLEDCRARLSAEDSRMVVQANEISTGFIDASVPVTLLRGFDVKLSDDILDATISDPYDTHFRLDLRCSAEEAWELGFVLPVYRPTLPQDIDSQMRVDLEPTAGIVSAAEVTLRGTAVSSSSFIDSVTVRVNGNPLDTIYLDRATGAFEVRVPLEPGSNSIEVEAWDQSGASGYKTVFVNCRSSLTVSIDPLPSTSAAVELAIKGSAESSASTVDRLVLTVNGAEQPLGWQARRNRFEATITLQPGSNTIVVEAWDEAGAQGRATEYVRLGSQFSIVLDSLPAVTAAAAIEIAGTVTSSSPVERVELLVNGAAQAVSYNAPNGRFRATVNLLAGGNTITAEALGAHGERATDRAYVTRTVAFIPPSISISSPGPGTSTSCGPVIVSGTFDPGNSSVEQIAATTNPAYLGCQPVVIGGSTFSVECGVDAFPGDGFYSVELRTVDGNTAADTVLVQMLGCN